MPISPERVRDRNDQTLDTLMKLQSDHSDIAEARVARHGHSSWR